MTKQDEARQPGQEPVADAELAKIAYDGFDAYWTEDSKGLDAEAWAASARAVLAKYGNLAAPVPAQERAIEKRIGADRSAR